MKIRLSGGPDRSNFRPTAAFQVVFAAFAALRGSFQVLTGGYALFAANLFWRPASNRFV